MIFNINFAESMQLWLEGHEGDIVIQGVDC